MIELFFMMATPLLVVGLGWGILAVLDLFAWDPESDRGFPVETDEKRQNQV